MHPSDAGGDFYFGIPNHVIITNIYVFFKTKTRITKGTKAAPP